MKLIDTLNVDDDAIIWRYFDFPKFVHALEFGCLFFSRLDLLGDPFEGSVTAQDLSTLTQEWISMSQDSGTPAGLYEMAHRDRGGDPRHGVYVSCWHMSTDESVAMWKLYAADMKGIAIKSTVGKIRKSMPSKGNIRKVVYIDYSTDRTLHLSPAYCKRKAFEYEREVRAVIPDLATPSPAGIVVKVDLNAIIDEIRVSPGLPSWMNAMVQALLGRYGVNAHCVPSSLDAPPQFDWDFPEGAD